MAARRSRCNRRGLSVGTSIATDGAVAQLGERLNGIQEVESSILFGSTDFPTGSMRAFPGDRPGKPSADREPSEFSTGAGDWDRIFAGFAATRPRVTPLTRVRAAARLGRR